MAEETGNVVDSGNTGGAAQAVGANDGAVQTKTEGSSGQANTAVPATGEVPGVREPAARTYKLKVRGEERELPESDVLTAAQRFYGGEDKFKEAAALRKEAEEIKAGLASDDLKVSRAALQKAMGNDKLRAVAIKLLEEELEEQRLTPEQKRLRDAERKAEELEAKNRQHEEAMKTANLSRQAEALMPKLDEEIAQAFDKSSLPKSPHLLKQVIMRRKEYLEQGVRVPFATIVKELESETQGFSKSTIAALKDSPKKLLALLGDDVGEAIHKHYLGKIKVPANVNNITGNAPIVPADGSKTAEPDSITPDEFRERMEAIKAKALRGG